ncbi:MAG: hypothetical protein M1816_007772 [Peltula sp. TS41687]|nr:MAG: hypothetical protein M1816_007772 [Peltula sp. TS41687]
MQYLNPTDHDTYVQIARERGFTPRNIALPDGTRAFWLGAEDAKRVILFLHGGGYVMTADKNHWRFVWNLKKSLDQSGHDVAVLFLEYDIAPAAPYPRQLQQAAALLDHTVNVLGRRPSDIMIAGDSAGGNLVLAVLSHLSHPHREIAKVELAENLRGAVVISPWVDFDSRADSMTFNERKDMLTAKTLDRWAAAFMLGASTDPYNRPLTAPSEWWRGLKVNDVLIVAGADEIMVDDIRAFAKKFESVHPSTTTVIAPEEPHDSPLIFRMVGISKPGRQEQAVSSWMAQRI